MRSVHIHFKDYCLLLFTQRNEAAGFHNTMVDVHQARRHHTSLVTAVTTSILYTDTRL